MRPELDQTFAALGDPTRLAVIGLLRKKPLRSGDLAAALSTTRPTMSRHLQVLRRAGLVEEEETPLADDARARTYRLRAQPFAEVRSWLEEVEAFWGDQLHGFKAHVERAYGKKKR